MALGIASSQATVAATETLICANRTYRKTITIINEGTTDVRIAEGLHDRAQRVPVSWDRRVSP